MTLADVRDILAKLVSPEAKLQISAINTVARASACAPDDLPADPARLRQHLTTISPAMAGLTKASWSSVRSRIASALQRAEVQVMPGRRTEPLSEDWAKLYRALSQEWQAGSPRSTDRLPVRPWGISRTEVSDGHITRFAWELDTTSLRGRPVPIVRAAIRGWNAAVEEVPGWPQQRLTLPEIRREGYVLPAAELPRELPEVPHCLPRLPRQST